MAAPENAQKFLAHLQKITQAAESRDQIVPSFKGFLDILGSSIPKQAIDQFVKIRGEADILSGLVKSTAVLPRYAPQLLQKKFGANFAENQSTLERLSSSEHGHNHFLQKLCPFLIDRACEFPSLFSEGKLPFAGYVNLSNSSSSSASSAYDEQQEEMRKEQSFSLTRKQCLCIHSMNFLGASPQFFPQIRNDVGNISWWNLMWQSSFAISRERLLCQLIYFEFWRFRLEEAEQEDSDENNNNNNATANANNNNSLPQLDDIVTYTRITLNPAAVPKWSSLQNIPLVKLPDPDKITTTESRRIENTGIHVEAKFMEEYSEADAHVDFANEQLMIGRIIPSMTQEEIMFSARPEALLALSMFDTMRVNEAIVMRNVRMYVNYTGYRDSFRAKTVHDSVLPSSASSNNPHHGFKTVAPTIIAIDSSVNHGDQFKQKWVDRDLMKLFVGFSMERDTNNHNHSASSSNDNVIASATGYGCGAFNNDIYKSTIQQLCAAAVSGNNNSRRFLCLYDRNPDTFMTIVDLLREKKISVAQAYMWMIEFGNGPNCRVTCNSSDAAPPIQAAAGKTHQQKEEKVDENSSSSSSEGKAKSADSALEESMMKGTALLESDHLNNRSFGHFLLEKLIKFKFERGG